MFFELFHSFRSRGFSGVANLFLLYLDRELKNPVPLSQPVFAQIELTTACNLNCIMCEHSFKKSSPSSLDAQQVKKIVEKLPFVFDYNLTGIGESLLNKDFLKIVSFLKQNGKRVWFNDNFMLFDEKISTFAVETQVDAVVASVDAATKKTFEKIRRGASFEKVVNNIKALDRIKKEHSSKKPEIIINFVATAENIAELEKIVSISESLGARKIIVSKMLQFEENKGLAVKDYSKFFKKVCQAAKKSGISLQQANTMAQPPCENIFKNVYISADGLVSPCCYFAQNEKAGEIDFWGNILQQDFKEIWKCKKAAALRSALAGKKVPGICKNCFEV